MDETQLITADELRDLLDYQDETGIFKWRFNPARERKWNSRHAGKAAGSLSYGYVKIRIGRLYPAHRLAWLYVHGEWPPEHIDHINGDKSDNRIGNLRCATRSENLRNRGIQSNNTSGFAGVRFRAHHGKWEARIAVQRKTVWRRYFDSAQEAAAARRKALPQFHGEFARIS